MHYFSVAWLRAVADTLRSGGSPSSSSSLAAAAAAAGSSSSSGGGAIVPSYHVAQKTIPSKDGPVAGGVKLELFIFDAFPLAARTALLEVDRATEFAPVKNAPGAAADSPDTARGAALKLGASWVVAAGGRLEGEAAGQGVEVSPLVSYGGEGLEWCDGAVFTTSGDARLQKASVM